MQSCYHEEVYPFLRVDDQSVHDSMKGSFVDELVYENDFNILQLADDYFFEFDSIINLSLIKFVWKEISQKDAVLQVHGLLFKPITSQKETLFI